VKVFVTAVTGAVEADVIATLKSAGHDVVEGRGSSPYSEAELIELTREADAIVAISRDRISRKVLESAERLRLVVAPFVGVDHIDVEAATELGILVANSPGLENVIGVAEATIGLMLALMKRVKRNEATLRSGGWRRAEDQGDLLYGKTVGIVGLGRIGSHVAKRLAPWDVTLLANDPYVTTEYATRFGAGLTDLPTLLRSADIVTLHVVLTDETRNLIGEKELRQMKSSAFLVNTARGGVVDQAGLARAVEEKWIAGAALDAFPTEPLQAESALRRLDPERVILTPHNVGLSDAARRGNWALAMRSVREALEGKVPAPTKNPDAVPGWRDRLRRSQEQS
jgi:D-3-phosphoglycerate dehydrogenase